MTFGRGGGTPWQNRGGGSREHHQEGAGRDWQQVGRGGSTRPRDLSTSPQEGRGPPWKKVNTMASPDPARTRSSPITISPNRYRMPQGVEDRDLDSTPLIDLQDMPSREEGAGYDKWGEVLDDVVEVGAEVEVI